MCVLQATGLAEHRESGAPAPTAAGIRMHLPDVSRLSRLTALNLSDNRLTRVPPMIGKLKQLQMLDLSCNQEMQVSLLLGLHYWCPQRSAFCGNTMGTYISIGVHYVSIDMLVALLSCAASDLLLAVQIDSSMLVSNVLLCIGLYVHLLLDEGYCQG